MSLRAVLVCSFVSQVAVAKTTIEVDTYEALKSALDCKSGTLFIFHSFCSWLHIRISCCRLCARLLRSGRGLWGADYALNCVPDAGLLFRALLIPRVFFLGAHASLFGRPKQHLEPH